MLVRLGVLTFAIATIVPSVWRWEARLCGDEPGFLRAGMLLTSALVDGALAGDFSDPIWNESLENYGRYHPKVGVFILGALGHATSSSSDPGRTRILRAVAAAAAVGCVLLMFEIAATTGTWVSGVLAALVLSLHPAFHCMKAAILPDVPMTLFSLLALWMLVRFAGSAADRGDPFRANTRIRLYLLGFGLFAGLAVSCKLYACSLFGVLPVVLWQVRRREAWTVLAWAAGACALALALFVVSNPMLYSNPVDGMRLMTSGHLDVADGEGVHFFAESLARTWPAVLHVYVPQRVDVSTDLYELRHMYVDAPFFVGIVLFVAGGIVAVARRNLQALAWAASSFALIAYTYSRVPPEFHWGHPRMFLLPAVALAWLASGIDREAARSALRAIRRVSGTLAFVLLVSIPVGFVGCSGEPETTRDPVATPPSPITPAGMLLISADRSYVLGEEDPTSTTDVMVLPHYYMPVGEFHIGDFWIAEYPFPGKGEAWIGRSDTGGGLSYAQVRLLDERLAPVFGRRLCTVEELLLAGAGPENQRLPYGADRDVALCDVDQNPARPIGGFPGCVSPLGVHDILTRSLWAHIDDESRAHYNRRAKELGWIYQLPGDMPVLVVHGLNNRVADYGTSVQTLHWHFAPGDPWAEGEADVSFVDDYPSFCADPDDLPTAEQEAAFEAKRVACAAAGSFEPLLSALREGENDRQGEADAPSETATLK